MAATRIFIICHLLCMMKENCFFKNTIPTTSQKLLTPAVMYSNDLFCRVQQSEVCRYAISYLIKKEREGKAANLPDVSRECFPLLFDKLALFTEDVLTCHSRKSTAMNNKFNGLIFVF